MQNFDFEKSLTRLEEIAQLLETGELSLDESLKIFEEGIKLSRFCEGKLTKAEQKLEILKSTNIEDFLDEKSEESQIINKKKTKKNIKIDDEICKTESDGSFLF